MLTVKAKTRKAGKLVDTTHVDNVIRNYKQHRWANNSKYIGKEDSLSVWFSIDEIEEFLAKAKEHGGDGIRFYFGAYSNDFAEQPLYAGRQTIVMVATQEKKTVKGTVDKDIYIGNEEGVSILAYNVGKLCPPVCKPSLDGDDYGLGITIVDNHEGIVIV
jgi:hypothetical protein